MVSPRHCEERSDEAIHFNACGAMDCFAALAMTADIAPFHCFKSDSGEHRVEFR